MNGEIDEAMGLLATPAAGDEAAARPVGSPPPVSEDFWRWRLRVAQAIAEDLDAPPAPSAWAARDPHREGRIRPSHTSWTMLLCRRR
jgi:hypothetical protein